MSKQMKSGNEEALARLANDIQTGHRRCIDSVRGLISQARCVGAWLEEAKKLVPHGRWMAWVDAHCHLTNRMAQKYMLVARHYDALVARFSTDEEWTLTEFFSLASKMEAAARDRTRSTAKARPATFQGGDRGCKKKVNALKKRREKGPLVAESAEPVQCFIHEQCKRLAGAIRRFAGSKAAQELLGPKADGLDTEQLGILMLEGLKAALDPAQLFAPEDATDAEKPAHPVNRVRHQLNGAGSKPAA